MNRGNQIFMMSSLGLGEPSLGGREEGGHGPAGDPAKGLSA